MEKRVKDTRDTKGRLDLEGNVEKLKEF